MEARGELGSLARVVCVSYKYSHIRIGFSDSPRLMFPVRFHFGRRRIH